LEGGERKEQAEMWDVGGGIRKELVSTSNIKKEKYLGNLSIGLGATRRRANLPKKLGEKRSGAGRTGIQKEKKRYVRCAVPIKINRKVKG